jgi:hypothetical protein
MSELVNFERSPDYLSKEVSETFSEIVEIVKKTIWTLFNELLLLKLSPEIQTAVSEGTLPVSQGYLLAANLDCPNLRNSVEF